MAYFSLFIWTVMLAVACAVDEDNPVELRLDPSTGLFTTTTRVSIRCLYTSDYIFDSFVHPVYGQIQSTQGNYLVTAFTNDISLEILEPSQVDDGLYFCTFDHVTQNTRRHASGTLTFQDSVNILSQQTSYDGIVGENVTLRCETEHATSVQWRFNQRTVTSTDRITSERGMLTFHPVQLEDMGEYTCVVANDVSLITLDVELSVTKRPVVDVTPDMVIVEEGDSAEFLCKVEGLPLPMVKWVELSTGVVVMGSEQISTAVMHVDDMNLQSRLTFSNVTMGHIGSYKCEATNSAGTVDSKVTLDLVGTPEAVEDLALTLVNQTNIFVTWSAPRGMILSYTVTWQAESSDLPKIKVLNDTVHPPTSYLITDLKRLTMYSVFVHGTNDIGRGVDTEQVITTDAVAPSGEVGLSVFDLGPTSTQVEYDLSSVDNGGADVTRFRLLYAPEGQTMQSMIVSGPGPILLSSLNSNTEYQLQAQPGNRIGFATVSQTIRFTTSPVGYPGSPSHVTTPLISESSISLCWEPSTVGEPFLNYTITGVLHGSEELKEWTVSVEELETLANCTGVGFTIQDLPPETCYQFRLTVTNSEGTGQSSDLSEQECTLPPLIAETPPVGDQQRESSVIIASVVVGVLLAVCILVLVILCCCCWLKLRMRDKFNLPDIDRRESERSDTNLMTYQQQISTTSSSLDGSPQTASTEVSNPFIFTTSPQSDAQFYYNGTGVVGPTGSNTLGPSYPPSPVQQLQPRSAHSLPAYYAGQEPPPLPMPRNQSDFEMTDNPYYKKFQLHKIPEHEEHINFAYVSVPVPGAPGNTGHTLPMYYGDNASEVAPSEVSSIQMGESCSQPSMSPKLKKKKKKPKHSPNHTSHQQAYPASDGTDFTDNNAYETVPHVLGRGYPNGHNIYSSDMDLESEPRFEIQSQERGAVKETVQFRL